MKFYPGDRIVDGIGDSGVITGPSEAFGINPSYVWVQYDHIRHMRQEVRTKFIRLESPWRYLLRCLHLG